MPDHETESVAELPGLAPPVDYVDAAATVTEDSPDTTDAVTLPLKVEPLSRGVQQELDLLRALSDEQEARNRRAQSITTNLHRQFQLAEAENSRIRTELQEVRADLTLAQQGSHQEIRLAATRETHVREELAAARTSATSTIEGLTRCVKKWQRISAGLAVAMALLAGTAFWQGRVSSASARMVESQTSQSHPAEPRPANKPASDSTLPTSAMTKPASHDFTDAMVTLDRALAHFRGNNPEDVIRRIRNEGAAKGISVCSFEWNDGEPSLLFGTGERNLGLDTVIAHCADAIEKAAQ